MLSLFARKLAYTGATLAGMAVLVFAATHILPGNVAHVIAGQFASPEAIAALEDKLGLNQPLIVRFGAWALNLLRGDLGDSLAMERPIGPLLLEALQSSSVLALMAFFCVAIIGIGLGVVSALHRGRPLDHAASVFSYVGISVPEFFWGIVLILAFAGQLHWLPSGGEGSLQEGVLAWLSHLVLPVTTLTLTLLAHVSRMMRASMIDALASPYVRTARAKGLPERVVIVKHALQNAMLPTITVLAMDVGWLIGGIVVVEAVFSYPGLGRLLIFAIERRDIPLIQACILVVATIYCVANLAADLLYVAFNPKLRHGRAHG